MPQHQLRRNSRRSERYHLMRYQPQVGVIEPDDVLDAEEVEAESVLDYEALRAFTEWQNTHEAQARQSLQRLPL